MIVQKGLGCRAISRVRSAPREVPSAVQGYTHEGLSTSMVVGPFSTSLCLRTYKTNFTIFGDPFYRQAAGVLTDDFYWPINAAPNSPRAIPVDEPNTLPIFAARSFALEKMCFDWCWRKSNMPMFMGLEYGTECYCSENQPCDGDHRLIDGDCLSLHEVPQNECNMLCGGDSGQICGKSNVLLPVAPVSRWTPSTARVSNAG